MRTSLPEKQRYAHGRQRGGCTRYYCSPSALAWLHDNFLQSRVLVHISSFPAVSRHGRSDLGLLAGPVKMEDFNCCSTHHPVECFRFELQCPILGEFNRHITGQIGAHHYAI